MILQPEKGLKLAVRGKVSELPQDSSTLSRSLTTGARQVSDLPITSQPFPGSLTSTLFGSTPFNLVQINTKWLVGIWRSFPPTST